MNQNTSSPYETPLQSPSLAERIKIAHYFDGSIDDLLKEQKMKMPDP